MQISQPKTGDYILMPGVSSERRTYIPIGFYDANVISTNANYILPNGTLYEFAILTSLMHNDWMRQVAGRLKSDYRYSAKVVYNTFPWPEANDAQRKSIIALAKTVLLTRENYQKTRWRSYMIRLRCLLIFLRLIRRWIWPLIVSTGTNCSRTPLSV